MQSEAQADFLIIGAGFAGLVIAERLAAAGWKCVVVDRRSHLGGNAYDEIDAAGVLIHRYGPHYFRTNSSRIIDYLSRFTEWHEVDYTIKSFARGMYWSFPINLNTYEEYLGRSSSSEEFAAWLETVRVPIAEPENSEEVVISQIGRELYELFFENYTLKQWCRHPRELDPSVCGRIPVRTNRDNRYLTEQYQALPRHGFTAMFERMVDASPRLELHLGMEYQEACERWRFRHLVFTGALDEYFDYLHGPLPYRSLRFEAESFSIGQLAGREAIVGKSGYWQPAVQVNFPGLEVSYTRIVEMKHATGQRVDATTIIREYPKDWRRGEDAYYPVPAPESRAAYQRYAMLADAERNVSFVGRLATYRYYNMDQVIGMALAEAHKLIDRYGSQTS